MARPLRRTRKRSLGVPTYVVDEDNPGSDDGVWEAVEEVGTPDSEPASTFRSRRRDTRAAAAAEAASSPRGLREEAERKERIRADDEAARVRAIRESGDPYARLRLGTQEAGAAYMGALAKSDVLAKGQTKPSQRTQLSDLHQAYVSMMVLQCVKPLREGVSAENMLSSVGMGTMMWMISPNFRNQVGGFFNEAMEAVGKRLNPQSMYEGVVKFQGEASRATLNDLHDRTGLGRESLSPKDEARLARYEKMERGWRDLFTEHSAALTHVGLSEAAYREMRVPGADIGEVNDRYESALSSLYQDVANDGLDRNVVAANMRLIVGHRMDAEPGMASVFGETGHGRFVKGAPRGVVVPGTDRTTMAWTGDFKDSFDGSTVNRGTFGVREPMDSDQHRSAASETIYGEMMAATSVGEFNDIMEQYMVGSVTRAYPEAVDLTADPASRSRLTRSRSMFWSMADDGLSDQQQKLVYTGAYLDALTEAARLNPDLVRGWGDQFGPGWPDRMAETIDRYSDLGEEARDGGPQPEPVVHDPSPDAADPRFTSGADGVSDMAPATEDIVDAIIVEDEDEEEDDRAPSTDVVVADEGGGSPEVGNEDEARLALAGVDWERAHDPMGSWLREGGWGDGPGAQLALVEAMSDHMARDIYGASHVDGGPVPDGAMAGWEAMQVYSSRAKSLGEFDPSELAGADSTPEDYIRERSLKEFDHEHSQVLGRRAGREDGPSALAFTHRPWPDAAANTRSREMMGMALSMSGAHANPIEQDFLHSVAYVRALEKVVAADPAFEKVLRNSMANAGVSDSDWRQHEFRSSLSRTATYRGDTRDHSYAAVSDQLDLEGFAVRGAAPGSPSGAESEIRSGLGGSTQSAHATEIVMRRSAARESRHRQNLAAAGDDVVAGRFETPDHESDQAYENPWTEKSTPSADGPEMGG